MKKIYNLNILLLVALLLTSACEEEKVKPFAEGQGINFIATDGPAQGKDTYSLLNRSVDMMSYYKKGMFDFKYDTLKVLIRLEGAMSDKPLKVTVKALPIEGYETPEFIIPETSIKPGNVVDTVRIYTKRVTHLNYEYKAQVVFDYSNSDVVAGVKERQQFILTVSDKFPLEAFTFAANENDWNTRYSSLLGEYGEQKIRLIYSVLRGNNSVFQYCHYYDLSKYLEAKIPDFKAALKAYNDKYKDNPLKEDDGRLVTFI